MTYFCESRSFFLAHFCSYDGGRADGGGDLEMQASSPNRGEFGHSKNNNGRAHVIITLHHFDVGSDILLWDSTS